MQEADLGSEEPQLRSLLKMRSVIKVCFWFLHPSLLNISNFTAFSNLFFEPGFRGQEKIGED